VVDEVSDSPIGRGQSIKVNDADVQMSAKAVRLDVSSGDIITAQETLLQEVCQCISAQTTILKKEFADLKATIKASGGGMGGGSDQMENLIDAVKAQGRLVSAGGGGGGAGGGGGGENVISELGDPATIANIRASVKGFHVVSETLDRYQKALEITNRTTKQTEQRLKKLTETLGDSEKAEEALAKETKIAREAFSKFHKDMGRFVTSGVMVQIQRTFEDLATTLFRFGERLGDVRGAWGDVKRDLEQYDSLLKSGQVNLLDFATQLGSGTRGLMSLDATVEAMNKSMQANAVTPFATMGDTVDEIRASLFQFRENLELEGFDWKAAMDSAEMTSAMIELAGLERRASVSSDIRDIDTRRNVGAQLKVMQDISFVTGKSLNELIEINRKVAEEVTELEVLGAVSQSTAANLKNLGVFFEAQGKEGAPAYQAILKLFKYGESGIPKALAENPGLAVMIQQNPELMQTANKIMGGRTNLQDIMDPLRSMQNRGGLRHPDITQLEGAKIDRADLAATKMSFNAIFTNIDERLAKFDPDAPTSRWDDMFRGFQDTIKQNFPDAATNMIILAGAVALNTAALLKNTWALLFGGLFRGIGKLFGRSAGAASGASAGVGAAGAGIAGASVMKNMRASASSMLRGSSLAGATTSLGAAGAGVKAGAGVVGMAGGAARAGGSLLAKLVPGLGTAISGGLAVSDFMEGDVLGGVGHSAAAIASLFPGIGTAIAFAIEGGLLARELTGEDTGEAQAPSGPESAGIPRAPSGRTGSKNMAQMMSEEIGVLRDMLSVLVAANEINRGIKDKISLGGNPSVVGPEPGGRPSSQTTTGRSRGPNPAFATRIPAGSSIFDL
jgi:hypothetical protein